MESLFNKSEEFFKKYERHVSSLVLLGGFIFDSLTLKSIDLLFENLTIMSYLVLSGGSILLLNYFEEKSSFKFISNRLYSFLPFFIQFAFGGLFSAFFIFYTRSTTISSSWPFILILLILLVGNEFFKDYYQKLTFQVSIFFIATFSFSIFFVPVLLKTMGATVFLLSGIISLLIILFFTRLLFRVVPDRYQASQSNLRNSIISIFIIINILYFSNLIPPIPLALKNAGVYHSIEKVGENYHVLKERKGWGHLLPFVSKTVHLANGQPLYIFSSVFAPTDLDTTIMHDWQYFDEETGEWINATRTIFSITGGRRAGYRVFSKKENLFNGKWRVDVKTERSQIIGRVRFNIAGSSGRTVFQEEVL